MRFLCRIGWHNWGKYEPPHLVDVLLRGEKQYTTMYQRRECLACGKQEDTDVGLSYKTSKP